jgi:hypothetical protein
MENNAKKELLEMLKQAMQEMISEEKSGLFSEVMPKKKEMSKVTVMGDSPKAVEEGLSKAQQIMKAKLGKDAMMEDSEEESEEEDKEVCPMCKKMPCECEE